MKEGEDMQLEEYPILYHLSLSITELWNWNTESWNLLLR